MNRAGAKSLGLVLMLAAVATLAACVQAAPRNEPTAVPSPEPTNTPVPPTPSPSPAPTVEPTSTSTPSPTPEVTPPVSGTPTVIPVSNTKTVRLELEIEGLSDGSIVYGDSIVVRGQTTVDAVLSINGVIVPIDETGRFEVPLILAEGPNFIEIVASDLDGNRINSGFRIVSFPEDEQEGLS